MRACRAERVTLHRLLWCAALVWTSCGSTDQRTSPPSGALELPTSLAESPAPATPRLGAHAKALAKAYDPDEAMETLRFVDRFFRVRGNVGYMKSVAYVRESLLAGGYAESAVRTLDLGPERSTWTPVKGSLQLLENNGAIRALHKFSDETGRDRATLLVGSKSVPALSATKGYPFDVVTEDTPEEMVKGRVVLGMGSPRSLFKRFVVDGGAAGILTLFLEDYHRAEAQPTVAQFGYLPRDEAHRAFGFSISPATDRALRDAIERGDGRARIGVSIEVKEGTGYATTIEATIEGSEPSAPPVVFVTHVDEPGANDNASGVAALLELAVTMRREVEEGRLPRPRHSIVFLWGQEIECSREWLAAVHDGPVLAGLVFDMVGADQSVVGAPALIERMPDPGNVWMRPPDESSGWGGSTIDESLLHGHYLNDYVLTAVRTVADQNAGWQHRDHPFEGGSDHVPFLMAQAPALLVWHFPDDAYHTNLDRSHRISGVEMQRVSSALGAVALGLASGTSGDRAEVLAATVYGLRTRLRFAAEAIPEALALGSPPARERHIIQAWSEWYDEALLSIDTERAPELADAVQSARDELDETTQALLRQLRD